MKKLFIVLSTISFILLSGCSNSERPDNKLSDEPADIPETLSVNVDLPQNLPPDASTYKVSYKAFDSDELLEHFHMKPVSSSERDAIGQRYESGNSLLYVYDDDGVLYGGFSYTSNDILIDINPILAAAGDTNFMKDKASDDLSDIKALSFLENIGLEIDRAYEFSVEELNEFIKSSDDFTSQYEGTFNPKDIISLVYLSQSINDIPITTIQWDFSLSINTCSEAWAIFFDNQMVDNRFVNLYDVEQEISNDKIISPETALNTFIADYNKKMQFDTTTITNISLNYVVTVDKDGMYAQPAYIIETERKTKPKNSPEPVIVDETRVISAINGEFIWSAEVGI